MYCYNFKRKSYNNLLGLVLKREAFTLTVLSFFSKMFLHHVVDGKVRVLLFSKIVKIQISLKTLKKSFSRLGCTRLVLKIEIFSLQHVDPCYTISFLPFYGILDVRIR